MSATCELRERPDQTAELQDLLLCLQAAQLDGELVHVGGWRDPRDWADILLRKFNESVNKRWVSRKQLVKTCDDLLAADAGTFEAELKEDLTSFMETLRTPTDRTSKVANVLEIAEKWKFLKPLLLTYKNDNRNFKDKQTSKAKTQVGILLKQMELYSKYWSEQFKKTVTPQA